MLQGYSGQGDAVRTTEGTSNGTLQQPIDTTELVTGSHTSCSAQESLHQKMNPSNVRYDVLLLAGFQKLEFSLCICARVATAVLPDATHTPERL